MRPFLLRLILASLVTTGGFAREHREQPILKAANRWKVGELIAKDLLVYRKVDGCLAVDTDTVGGMRFDSVRRKYQAAHEYSYVAALSDGKNVKLTRTHVGNYGDYVISEQSRTAHPLRFADTPPEHVAQLLERKSSDVVVLRDEREKQDVLYRVREIYRPET